MPGNEKPPRALLPRISPEESITPELVPETSQGLQDASAAARVRATPGARSNIRSACLACRQRRSKCSGGVTCGRCRTRGTDCVYEELQDRRTRAVREKGKEELDLHRKVINGVFKAIQNGGNQSILDLVRQHASLQTIAAAISDDSAESESDDQAHMPSESQTGTTPSSIIQGLASSTPRWDAGRRYTAGSNATARVRTDSTTHPLDSAYKGDDDSMSASFTDEVPSPLAQDMAMAGHDSLLFPHMLKPLHSVNLVPLDDLSNFYVHFLETSQTMTLRGIPLSTILGPSAVTCSLLFRAEQFRDPYNLTAWASSVVGAFPDLDVYFRLAWLVLLVRFMRWYIEPTEESFQMVPDIMRPTPLQLSTPHTPYVDLVPLPLIRDSLIANPNDFTTALQLAGANLYWPASFEAAVHHDHATGAMTVTERFEKHVANANHYRFGRRFLQTFPDLESHLNIAEQDHVAAMPFMSGFP